MYNLDIPDHYTSTANYAATLAHKVHLNVILTFNYEELRMLFSIHCDLLMMKYISFCCEVNYAYCVLLFQACHSFTPNSSFINLYHPRFVIFVLENSPITAQIWQDHVNCCSERFAPRWRDFGESRSSQTFTKGIKFILDFPNSASNAGVLQLQARQGPPVVSEQLDSTPNVRHIWKNQGLS